MTEQNQVRELRRMVNRGEISLKDVYTMIMRKPVRNRLASQSRDLHDNHYREELNSLAHIYMEIEYPARGY